jgi:DNA-directed RNA polymerase subunit M/transcription elongation factor TFIIS
MESCRRCNGLMVLERVTDQILTTELWRCVNCGALVDHVIQQNQHVPYAQRASA